MAAEGTEAENKRIRAVVARAMEVLSAWEYGDKKSSGSEIQAILREVEEPMWKLYNMDDCDWWIARSREEASQASGIGLDEDLPEEVSAEKMETLTFFDGDGHIGGKGCLAGHSFRIEFDRRIAAGLSAPEFFASTEG